MLGTSLNMTKLVDICNLSGIKIAGIIDSDYYGNTDQYQGIPVIDTQESFNNTDKLDYYRDNYNFFCAVNWGPEQTEVFKRNRDKRHLLLDLIDQHKLECISLVDPLSRIASDATIGRGVFIDAMCLIESEADIHDYVSIYAFCGIGHHTTIMRNCVFQRHCSISGNCTFEPDTYLGTAVKALKTGAVFGAGTFIHEAVYIRRGTVPNEIVGMNGKNMSRVKVI